MVNDRKEAGHRLAERLVSLDKRNITVFGLSAGGVLIGSEVARSLSAILDLLLVHPLTAPEKPDQIFGAVGPDGTVVFDQHAIERLHLSDTQVERITARELADVRRRIRFFEDADRVLDAVDRTVILIDDQFSNPLPVLAAMRALGRFEPKRMLLACTYSTVPFLKAMESESIEVVYLESGEEARDADYLYEKQEGVDAATVEALLSGETQATRV